MERSIKWQDTPPPSDNDASESPTLSDKNPTATGVIKRKRSSIFRKLRKSILGLTETIKDGGDNNDKKMELKRALSMDAGLQNRISKLSSETPSYKELERNPSNQRIRRSKSLITSSITEMKEESPESGIGSFLASPRQTDQTTESLFEACESFNNPNTLSLINTLENGYHLHLSNQIYNCSWLAPTRKSQIFPGTISLLPKSAAIQFNCQHLTRSIRLKFRFDDILNISRGSWNDKHSQALIIDLIRGKRKTWVFVAWTDEQFQQAIDKFVHAWRCHCMNQIKSRLDRKRAYLNMKYYRIMREADQANEAVKLMKEFDLMEKIKNILNYFKTEEVEEKQCEFTTRNFIKYPSLRCEIFNCTVPFVTPQILSSILTGESTNFMTNFRALQGITISNDSGWHGRTKKSRNYVSIVSRDPEGQKLFKWKVYQEFKVHSDDQIVIQTVLQSTDSDLFPQIFKLIYEITGVPPCDLNSFEYSCNVKITGELEGTNEVAEKEICSYFSKIYFPSMFELLSALISESQQEFEADQESITTNPGNQKNDLVMELDLYFTTFLLPVLYKFLYFKEFKFLRLTLTLLILLFSFKLLTISLLNAFKSETAVDVEGDFGALIEDLVGLADESGNSVHSIKLKYQKGKGIY